MGLKRALIASGGEEQLSSADSSTSKSEGQTFSNKRPRLASPASEQEACASSAGNASLIHQAVELRDVDLLRAALAIQPESLHSSSGSERINPLQAVLSICHKDPACLQLFLAILEAALPVVNNGMFEEVINLLDDATLKALIKELFNVTSSFSNNAQLILNRLLQADVLRTQGTICDLYNELFPRERQRAD